MTFLFFCTLIAAAFLAAHCLMPRYPKLRCALYGHEPKCAIVGYDMRWHCTRCDKEVTL